MRLTMTNGGAGAETNPRLFGRFILDLLCGAIGFIAIAFVAVGVGRVVIWVDREHLPTFIPSVLQWVEIGTFIIDILGYGCFIVFSLIKLIRKLAQAK